LWSNFSISSFSGHVLSRLRFSFPPAFSLIERACDREGEFRMVRAKERRISETPEGEITFG
jgi:hypothetical protein